VYVDKMSFRGPFLVPRRVGEPLAEDDAEADVISAASPLELARRRLVRQRTAAALRRRPGTARFGDRLRQCGRRQRVDVRLLSTPYNSDVSSTPWCGPATTSPSAAIPCTVLTCAEKLTKPA